jgi:hypothetical protein
MLPLIKKFYTILTKLYYTIKFFLISSYIYYFTQNNFILIGVTGRKFSGKDTIGDYLVKHHGFIRLAYADTLKEALKIVFSFTDEQLYGEKKETVDEYWSHTPRELLQSIGTELFRDELPKLRKNMTSDIWIKAVNRRMIDLRKRGYNRFVVTDVRFPNEVDYIKNSSGVVWKVNRLMAKITQADHASEAHIDNFECSYEFHNNSTLLNLYAGVDEQIKKLII